MLEIDAITDIEDKLARLDQDKDWVVPEEIMSVDSWFPDYEEDIDKEIKGIFWKRIEPRNKPMEGEEMVMQALFIKPDHTVVGVREVQLVKNALSTVHPGDGVKIRYLGKQPIKNTNKSFHNFHIEIQRNTPKGEPLPTQDGDSEFVTGDKLPPSDEDPEARATIDMLINDWRNRLEIKDDEKPTAVQIISLALEDKEFAENTEAVEKLKAQLAKDVKAGKLEDGGE